MLTLIGIILMALLAAFCVSFSDALKELDE